MTALHEFYMRRCLELAQFGQGKTHPNPMVGCVVLDALGRKVGEGFHSHYGGPHAEVMALDQAGEPARGGTLYVSLEPCNHTGKTPPCTAKILDCGIQKVIYGLRDPNPTVTGQGAKWLSENGVDVEGGVLEKACYQLNEAFCYFTQTRRPFVVLKQAMTLDGKIATRNGQSQWITSPLARRWVHQLRSQCDGILTTAETVLQDDSQLTVRESPLLGNPPVRIVLDRKLRLAPFKGSLFKPSASGGEIWIFTAKGNMETDNAKKALSYGVKIFEVSENGEGLLLSEVLKTIGAQGITLLLVEAGGRLAGSLLKGNHVQKLWLLYGNQLMMDPAAKPGVLNGPLFRLEDALKLRFKNNFLLDQTWVVEAYPE